MVQSSPGKQFKRPYLEKTHHKNRAGGVAQGEGPEFKPQYHKKKKFKEISSPLPSTMEHAGSE
jgi:hypothetical protein